MSHCGDDDGGFDSLIKFLGAVGAGYLGYRIFKHIDDQRRLEAEAIEQARVAAEHAAQVERIKHFAETLLMRAAAVLFIPPPALILTIDTPTAATDGNAIFVNPVWLQILLNTHCNDKLCAYSVVLGIVAHELAHRIYDFNPGSGDHPHTRELRADYVAGQVIRALQVPEAHFAKVLVEISSVETETHPLYSERIRALRRGYEDAIPPPMPGAHPAHEPSPRAT